MLGLEYHQMFILGLFDGYNPKGAKDFEGVLEDVGGEEAIKYLNDFVEGGFVEKSKQGRIFPKEVYTLTREGFEKLMELKHKT